MEKTREMYQMLGSPLETDWQVIGPFTIGNFSGFHHRYPPEQKIDLKASYLDNKKLLQWQVAHDDHFDGYLNLIKIFGPVAWSVGYACTQIHSPEARQVNIRFGVSKCCKIWINKHLVWQNFQFGDSPKAYMDDRIIKVTLKSGSNEILIKILNQTGDFGFYFRVTDENGKGYPDITSQVPPDIY